MDKRIVLLKDSEHFMNELKSKVEYWNTNHQAYWRGKIVDRSFRIERKKKYGNSGRPQLVGAVKVDSNETEVLLLQIKIGNPVVHKLFIAFTLINVLILLIQVKLVGIPIVILMYLFFRFINFLFSLPELKKAQEDLERLTICAQEAVPFE